MSLFKVTHFAPVGGDIYLFNMYLFKLFIISLGIIILLFILFFIKTISIKWGVVTCRLQISVMQWKHWISFAENNYIPLLFLLQETMKDYQEKKVRGELISQRVDFLKQNILSPVI